MRLEEFVELALLTPFVEHGRRIGQGWDCWGLVREAYSHVLGVELPSYAEDYRNTTDTKPLGELVHSHLGDWRPVIGELQLGDVPLFRVRGQPIHVGLLLDKRRMLHTMNRVGTTVERYDSITWVRRVEGVYRYAG